MTHKHIYTIIAVIIFSIAMAALESAVVVYLRALYYPDGFTVALKLIEERILLTEIAREAATLIMLGTIGYLSAKHFPQRFAYFLLSFAIWDIFYYIWLKIFIDWPTSLLEWDILFLIPITWLGPILAPVICSIMMVVLALVIIYKESSRITVLNWALLSLGSLLILYTFVIDYIKIFNRHNLWSSYAHIMQEPTFLSVASNFIPTSYDWITFMTGVILIFCSTINIFKTSNANPINA